MWTASRAESNARFCAISPLGNAYSAPRRTAFSFVSASRTGFCARASRKLLRTHSPNGQALVPGQSLDLQHLPIRQQHLQSLTHTLRIACYLREDSIAFVPHRKPRGSTLARHDLSALRNPPHERAFAEPQDATDRRERRYKDSRDFTTSQVAGNENEYPSPAGSQCRNLQRPIAQPLVLGRNDPSVAASYLKPDSILLVALEVIVVDFNGQPLCGERASDWLNAQRPVEEEDSPVRRLRSGSLLRRHLFPIGNPGRDRQPNRQPCSARTRRRQESPCPR